MAHFTFFIFNFVIFIPFLSIFSYIYGKQIQRNIKFVLWGVVFGIFIELIEDPVGTLMHAWIYDPAKSLKIFSFGINLDTVIFAIGVSYFFSAAIAVFAEREEKKKPLIKYI